MLDIGVGSGRHSLVLQERGLPVCASDIVPECVDVIKRRGVREAQPEPYFEGLSIPKPFVFFALDAGWNFEVVIRQDNGRYLTRLTPVER